MQPPPRKGNYAKFLKTLHSEQGAKLHAKNQYECELLEDIRTFVVKRSAIERSYAEALLKISSVYLNKKIPAIPDIKGDGGEEKWNMWSVWRTVLEENERLSRARLAAVEVFQQQVADDAKILRQHKISNAKRCLDQLAIVQKELQICVQELDKNKKIYFDEEHSAHDVRDRAKDIEEKLKKKKGSFFQSITSLQKNSAKISTKRDVSDQKSAGARNDYLLTLAAANAHQNRYFVVDLQNAITMMEAGVYERVAEYLTLIGRTELLTCHAMQTSFGRIKDQAMQLTRDYNIQCLYLFSPSLKQHIQYMFEPCDEDPIATVTPLETGGTSSGGDTAGLAKEARRWATRIGRETTALREGIRKLQALQSLRDSGQKTDPNDPNGPDLDSKIEDLRQSLRRSETAKMKAEARIECLRAGGVNVDEWLQDVESLGVLEIPRSASSLSVRTDATGEPVSSDSFYDSDFNDAGSEVTAVERGAATSKKGVCNDDDDDDDDDDEDSVVRSKGSQKKKTTSVSTDQDSEGKIAEDEEEEEEVTEQVVSVVDTTSTGAAGWDIDPTQVDWGPEDDLTPAPATSAEEGFNSQGIEASHGRSPGTTYKCIALYSYTAQNPDELSIVEGEALEVIIGGSGADDDDDESAGMGGEGDGWVKARNYQGEEGLVPQNYLEAALDDGSGGGAGGEGEGGEGREAKAAGRSGFHTQFSFSSVDYHVEDSSQKVESCSPKAEVDMVAEEEEESQVPKLVEEEVHGRRFQPPANICINGVGGDAPNYCIALYDYEATCPEELTFPEGCILRIIRKSGTAAGEDGEEVDDGWWEGEAPDGSKGLFPSLVVEPCRPNGEPLTPEGDDSPPGSAPPVFTPPDVPTYLLPPQHVFVTQPTPDVESAPITEVKPQTEDKEEVQSGPPPTQPPPTATSGFSMELAKGKQHHYKRQFGDQDEAEIERNEEREVSVPCISVEVENETKQEQQFEDDFTGADMTAQVVGEPVENGGSNGSLGVAQIVITAATPMTEEAEVPFPGTESTVAESQQPEDVDACTEIKEDLSSEEERVLDEGTESDKSQVFTTIEKNQEHESESGMSTSAFDETASDGSKGTIEEIKGSDTVGDSKMHFEPGGNEEFVELSDELEPTQLERLRGLKESDA